MGMLSVKSLFLTIQGEGHNVGRVAVFCRLTGCNLWSGEEADRATAKCRFCDTDFVGTDGPGGGRYQVKDLVDAIDNRWPRGEKNKMVVFTGGEPSLQVTNELLERCRGREFFTAIETNGTRSLSSLRSLNWICVSPKAGNLLVQSAGSELKIVWPQPHFDLAKMERLAFHHLFLQPMDGPNLEENTRLCVAECLRRPRWRLSLQAHKMARIV